jgi:hypothetical protein
MFPIDAAEAWDIDEELDFQIADLLLTTGSTHPHGSNLPQSTLPRRGQS